MTVPLFTLLGFALWTLTVLMVTVGVHRWSLILTGRAPIHTFPADAPTGPDWYRRATRAHLNCVENLPVYVAIVGVASFAGVGGSLLDALDPERKPGLALPAVEDHDLMARIGELVNEGQAVELGSAHHQDSHRRRSFPVSDPLARVSRKAERRKGALAEVEGGW